VDAHVVKAEFRPSDYSPFQGGKNLLGAGIGLGLLLVLASIAGLFVDPVAASRSYLISFTYWAGIGFASVVLLMLFHTVRAKWMVVLRRPLEVMASVAVVFFFLFLPLLMKIGSLYSWVAPSPEIFTKEGLAILNHKKAYLNVPFFVIRTIFYFALAGFIGNRLFGLSVQQDRNGDVQLTARQRALGAGALPFIALVFAFAGFDWLMSLQPLWFSTIFGVYYFAGSFVSAISILAITIDRARGPNLFGNLVSDEHVHNVGKLMLAFTCFWAYIAVSQLLLIWIANQPEEVPFYITRLQGAWLPVTLFLFLGHFIVPFGALLSRDLKRTRGRLVVVATWLLLMHLVDIYWLVIPGFAPENPAGGFHWTLFTSFIGMGLLAVGVAIWRVRGHFTLPVKDPYLSDSLRYRQP
jgi:hypothetical protein